MQINVKHGCLHSDWHAFVLVYHFLLGFIKTVTHDILIFNTKKGHDQKFIQLPNTFRSKTPKGKKDALKANKKKHSSGRTCKNIQ